MVGQVFISEYIEGSGNNKCIEIYNGSGIVLDLVSGGYGIEIYSNGSVSPGAPINFAGPAAMSLAVGDVYVICNSSAAAGLLALADQTTGSLNFNGNDAIALFNSGGILDVVGQIGFDPGTEWTGACCPEGSADGTLYRKPYLTNPSFDGSSAFDPDTEWDCDPVDTFSDLGMHATVGCAIDKLVVSQSSCNNGIATVSLDFTEINPTSANFQLTVTPDPMLLSGTYAYASLPLSLSGFLGDNTTQYDFLVEDLNPSCLTQELQNLVFNCPVADVLSFTTEPQGCVETTEAFTIQVCAIESSSGDPQPDYTQTITLSLNGTPSGTLTGATSQAAVNGCATFSFTYDAVETISFTASDGTLPSAASSSYPFEINCPALTIYTGFINPCGNDGPNELIAMSSGLVAVDVQDIVFASIDQSSAIQPDVRHTWSQSGSDLAGSTTRVCGGTSADIKCHRIMDISNPADNATITTLLGQLNLQAGCSGNLFVSPTGGGMGSIPSNSAVVMFLGAGGNMSGTIAAGFHGLGTNLDFSSYCGYMPIYAIFGEHINTITTFGFYSNTAARTYQVSIAGDITSQLAYPDPSSSLEPERVTVAGSYAAGGSCTPTDLFGDFVLTQAPFELELVRQDDEQVLIHWVHSFESDNGKLSLERSQNGAEFSPLVDLVAASSGSWMDPSPIQGHSYYRLKWTEQAGIVTYSEVQSIWLNQSVLISSLRLFPNPAKDKLVIHFRSKMRQEVSLQLLSADGKIAMSHALNVDKGKVSIPLDIKELSSGIFHLQLKSSGDFLAQTFVKQ